MTLDGGTDTKSTWIAKLEPGLKFRVYPQTFLCALSAVIPTAHEKLFVLRAT